MPEPTYRELKDVPNWDDMSTMKELTCRHHTDARYLTKNPWQRGLHVVALPEGIPQEERSETGECKCPFADLVQIVPED